MTDISRYEPTDYRTYRAHCLEGQTPLTEEQYREQMLPLSERVYQMAVLDSALVGLLDGYRAEVGRLERELEDRQRAYSDLARQHEALRNLHYKTCNCLASVPSSMALVELREKTEAESGRLSENMDDLRLRAERAECECERLEERIAGAIDALGSKDRRHKTSKAVEILKGVE